MQSERNQDFVSLFSRIREGDEEAREAVILEHIDLVRSAVKQTIRRRPSEKDDIIQEGILGLMRAVEGFNMDSGTKFSTYAYTHIRRTAERGLAATAHIISVPPRNQVKLSKIKRIANRDGISMDEAAEQLGISKSEYDRIIQGEAATRIVGDDAGRSNEDKKTWAEVLADDSQSEESMDRFAQCEEVREQIAAMDDRHGTVLRMVFGLPPFPKPLRVGEVARRLMISIGDVKKLKREGLAQIREILEFRLGTPTP